MKEKLIRISNPFKWYNGDLKRYLIFQIWTMLRTIDDFIMSITFQIVITDFGYHFICWSYFDKILEEQEKEI